MAATSAPATGLAGSDHPRPTQPATWVDRSPHRVGYVTVAPGVRLHYLDWGGTGDPLIFLTGLGNSAHSFDDIAPLFADRYHVLALTRRGQAESSKPPRGPYDIATLSDDIRIFLDSLHLDRVSLVGHSFAGQELTHFAIAYPGRVRRLVYLDAAFDYFFSDSAYATLPANLPGYPAAPRPTTGDCVSVDSFIAFSRRTFGIAIPEAEIRVTFVRLPGGSCGRTGTISDTYQALMGQGVERQNYRALSMPALAIYSVRSTLSEEEPWIQANPTMRADYALLRSYVAPIQQAERARFAQEARLGKVVEMHGAHHWVFVSNQADVVREMRAFLAGP